MASLIGGAAGAAAAWGAKWAWARFPAAPPLPAPELETAGGAPAAEERPPVIWISETRSYLRHGLTEQTAQQIARVVHELSGAVAVAITDRQRVVAFQGLGGDHHLPGQPIQTAVTRRVLALGQPAVVQSRREIGCPLGARCPLGSAVVVPLVTRGEVVGTLKLYSAHEGGMTRAMVELARGIGEILSLQMELAELERQAAEGMRARLEALRAQINPHFLFNVLNTVIAKVRTDPEQARHLLIRLADFFRYVTRTTGQLVPFSEEFAFVRTYLQLERARFGDRLRVVYDVDPQILGVPVPVLTVQPLVENAVKHGILPKLGPGTVTLRARTDFLAMRAYIEVQDDGVGAPPAVLREALRHRNASEGIGLANIRERLAYLYGSQASLIIDSWPGRGTRVRLSLPVRPKAAAGEFQGVSKG